MELDTVVPYRSSTNFIIYNFRQNPSQINPYSDMKHLTTSWNLIIRCCNKKKESPWKLQLLPCEDLGWLEEKSTLDTDLKEQIFSTACKSRYL